MICRITSQIQLESLSYLDLLQVFSYNRSTNPKWPKYLTYAHHLKRDLVLSLLEILNQNIPVYLYING